MTATQRIATPQELNFVLADLRASGVDAATLKQVLASRNAPATDQQKAAYDQLTSLLASYGAKLPETGSEDLEQPRFDAGTDANPRILAFAKACWFQGSDAYDDAVESGALSPDDDSVQLLKWHTPKDEVRGATEIVKRLLAQDPELRPCDVFVAVPNRTIANAVRKGLEEHEVKTTLAIAGDPFQGDPRSLERSALLQAFVRAHLLADPSDALAWRMWCGLGSNDLQVPAWRTLGQEARREGASALELLQQDGIAELPETDALQERARAGRAFIEQHQGLVGYSLFNACMPQNTSALTSLVEPVSGTETAQDLAGRLRRAALRPTLDDDPNCVRLGGLHQLLDQKPQVVIVLGAVDGFLPEGDETAGKAPGFRSQDPRALFCQAVAATQGKLLLSTFQKSSEQFARAFGLNVRRRKNEGGRTMAMLAPSPFIADAGNAAPSSQSGEQWL